MLEKLFWPTRLPKSKGRLQKEQKEKEEEEEQKRMRNGSWSLSVQNYYKVLLGRENKHRTIQAIKLCQKDASKTIENYNNIFLSSYNK